MYCSYDHKARKQLVDKVTYALDTLWDMTYNITFVKCIVAMLVCYLYLYTLVACIVVMITRLANNLMITFVTCIITMTVLYFLLAYICNIARLTNNLFQTLHLCRGSDKVVILCYI